MAGSRKFFVYTDDRAQQWAIELDESNTEAVNGSTGDYNDDATGPIYMLPRNVKPRTITYVSANGLVRRRVVALTAGVFAAPPTNFADQVSGLQVGIKLNDGERLSRPQALDTGLQDGDAT